MLNRAPRTEPLLQRIRRFFKQSHAVAAVEFALVFPFMLFLYVGTSELGQAIIVDRKVTVVSAGLGDLVARVNSSFSMAELNDYFAAAEATMAPYDTTKLKQVVTCVYVNAYGATNIVWSKGYNGGTAHTKNTSYALSNEMKNISKDGYVIVAETEYEYVPLLGYVFEDGFTLYEESFFAPRYGKKINEPS